MLKNNTTSLLITGLTTAANDRRDSREASQNPTPLSLSRKSINQPLVVDPIKFNKARIALGYDKENKNHDPTNFLAAYLSKKELHLKMHTKIFDSEIKSRYTIVTALKNNMIYPFPFNFKWFSEDRNHGRAARLVLCQEMIELFNFYKDKNFLNKEIIEQRYNQLNSYLESQKEYWWNRSFNREFKKINDRLFEQKKIAIEKLLGNSLTKPIAFNPPQGTPVSQGNTLEMNQTQMPGDFPKAMTPY